MAIHTNERQAAYRKRRAEKMAKMEKALQEIASMKMFHANAIHIARVALKDEK